MQVHYDEGVANHIGPEPCAGIREDVGEASAGERAGQPLSRAIWGRDELLTDRGVGPERWLAGQRINSPTGRFVWLEPAMCCRMLPEASLGA